MTSKIIPFKSSHDSGTNGNAPDESVLIPMNKNAALLSDMAGLFKALGDVNRLRIVLCLLESLEGQMTVSEIVEHLQISQPLTSHHLKELRMAGVVVSERRGPFVRYRITSVNISAVLESAANLTDTHVSRI